MALSDTLNQASHACSADFKTSSVLVAQPHLLVNQVLKMGAGCSPLS